MQLTGQDKMTETVLGLNSDINYILKVKKKRKKEKKFQSIYLVFNVSIIDDVFSVDYVYITDCSKLCVVCITHSLRRH